MDYLEERFKRAEVLNTIMQDIRVSNPHTGRGPAGNGGTSGEHQWRTSHQSLPPPPRHNGFLVTEGRDPGDGLTYYQDRPPPNSHQGHTRRQQSLPTNHKAEVHDKRLQPNSAPGNRKSRSQGPKGPLPKLNTLVAKSRGPGGETNHIVTTNFAGMSTRDHESSPTRYTRFASTWAQVRAENHIELCATSPENTARPSNASPAGTGSSPQDNKENARPTPADRKDGAAATASKTTPTAKPSVFHSPSSPPQKKRSPERREKTIRFVDEGGTRIGVEEEEEEDGQHTDHGASSTSPHRSSSTARKKRPAWDNRLNLTVPALSSDPAPQQPPKSWRRYEAELTHVPTVTSSNQVYKAYTGQTKQQVRTRDVGEDSEGGEEVEDTLEWRPSTQGSSQAGGEDGADGRRSKEYILTRNEAKMFLHLQSVYGSEAFRQHRKELFFKKLTDVQLQELQHQAADKRRKHQQREESKKRQRRQLMHVRRKFRREQLHRFRTQYVTSRVLEYEKGDRDLYGLPDDWDSDTDGVSGFEDLEKDNDNDSDKGNNRKDDSKAEDGGGRRDTTSKSVSSKKSTPPETVQSERGAAKKDSRADSTQKPAVTSRPKSNERVNSLPGNSNKNSSQSSPNSRDKTNSTGSKPVARKDSEPQRSRGGSVPQSETEKSAARATASKNPKPNKEETGGKSVTSQPSTSAMASSSNNNNKNSSSNKPAENALNGPKGQNNNASSNAKQQQQESGQARTAKDTVTADGRKTSARKDTPKAADASLGTHKNRSKNDSSSSPTKDPSASTKPAPGGDQSKVSGSQPAASSSKSAVPDKQEKTRTRSTDRNSAGTGKNGVDTRSAQKDKDAGVRKSSDSKPVHSDRNNNNHNNNNDRARKDNKDSSKGKEDKLKDGSEANSTTKQSPVSQNNRTTPTTSKDSGTKAPAAGQTAASSHHAVNGHASDTGRKPATSSNPAASSTATKDNKSSTGKQPADSRGRKRKPAQSQPKSEAEQKKQLEKKYGKMFDVNTGPTWNPGAKPPKMEGIDTVMIMVTDDKGRSRMKKREVKDVVKEAKHQLAVSQKETPRRRSAAKGGYPVQESPNDIRPASADTLDFDDDDDDDDDEDVFERVRRKYNLQIDSDDDDSTI